MAVAGCRLAEEIQSGKSDNVYHYQARKMALTVYGKNLMFRE
jgi:hypothetical protein